MCAYRVWFIEADLAGHVGSGHILRLTLLLTIGSESY